MKTIIDILISLININTYDTRDNMNMINYLKEMFKDCYEIKELLTNDNKYSLLIGVNTELKDVSPIVLSCHIDTVAANNNTKAIIKDDKVYGLGSCDMKAFLANILYNLDYLKNYNYPIVVCLTSDEETKFKAINDIIEYFKANNINPIFTILGEPTNLNLVVANKGCLEYQIEIFGKACHSSSPHLGVNSIYVASKIANFIEQLNKNYFNQGASMNVGILSGGTQVNIVPNYTRLNTDLRVSDLKQIDSVIETLTKLIKDLENEYNCKISLERKLFIPPLSNTNNSFINSYAKENDLIIEKAKYGTEAGYYQMIGSEVLIFGAGDIALAHNKEENVPISNLMKYQNYFINLMNKFRKELNI